MLIDSHCHLDFPEFDQDREQVLHRARMSGIQGAIVPAIGPENWRRVMQLCQAHHQLWFALGIHPCFATKESFAQLEKLEALLGGLPSKLVAVGECGLDGVNSPLLMPEQIQLCLEQMQLANRFNLPVLFHIRKAHHHLLALLDREPLKAGGVVHGFSGSTQVASEYLRRGLYLGVGGVITYPRASKTRTAVSSAPLERLLLETDSPDMPLNGHQGQRNEPQQAALVLQELSQLLDLPYSSIAQVLSQNHIRLFKRLS
ncbi:TatD family hydrolase [Ferrimonas futtsuensis]|uniref:TatD family hydrolase n=1 Tax=Ferrimonas futtsuensis TaxID=364764 RepID=UPI0004057780|nr:TatD family hydrolase [Ferrimonas futtsuensis]